MCRSSHNKDEIAYHPSRHKVEWLPEIAASILWSTLTRFCVIMSGNKTVLCSFPARPDGMCTRFGIHCAYAHGEDDIRRPMVLNQGRPAGAARGQLPHEWHHSCVAGSQQT